MRIGIDVDDTITNTYDYLIDKIALYYDMEIDKLRKRCLSYYDFINGDEFPNYDRFISENYEKLIPDVPIKEDAKEYLDKIHDEGYEIYIITARHDGEYKDPYKITADYLIKHKIPFDKIIVKASDKGIVCEEEKIDLFIDDSIRNCTKVDSRGIKALLFNAKFNRNEDRFKRVYNWEEVYNIIKEYN